MLQRTPRAERTSEVDKRGMCFVVQVLRTNDYQNLGQEKPDIN